MTDVKFSDFSNSVNTGSAPIPVGLQAGGNVQIPSSSFVYWLAQWVAANNVNFTFLGSIFASNLSGTNTGDQTDITGNAGTATALATPRTISMTGDVSWTVTFDGSANVTAAGTVVSASTTTAGKMAANDYSALQALQHAALGGL